MNKINKELVFAIVFLFVFLVSCSILQSIDAKNPPSVPPWEDPEVLTGKGGLDDR